MYIYVSLHTILGMMAIIDGNTVFLLNFIVSIMILFVLAFQSWILWKLLPEIRKISGDSDLMKRVLGVKK